MKAISLRNFVISDFIFFSVCTGFCALLIWAVYNKVHSFPFELCVVMGIYVTYAAYTVRQFFSWKSYFNVEKQEWIIIKRNMEPIVIPFRHLKIDATYQRKSYVGSHGGAKYLQINIYAIHTKTRQKTLLITDSNKRVWLVLKGWERKIGNQLVGKMSPLVRYIKDHPEKGLTDFLYEGMAFVLLLGIVLVDEYTSVFPQPMLIFLCLVVLVPLLYLGELQVRRLLNLATGLDEIVLLRRAGAHTKIGSIIQKIQSLHENDWIDICNYIKTNETKGSSPKRYKALIPASLSHREKKILLTWLELKTKKVSRFVLWKNY